MSDGVDRRVAGALRAQAAGLGSGAAVPSGRHLARRRTGGLPGWAVLALATLLGGLAGVVAGVVSAW